MIMMCQYMVLQFMKMYILVRDVNSGDRVYVCVWAGDTWTVFIASSLLSCKPKNGSKNRIFKKKRIGEILNQT